jgi:hypothetical protein
MKIKWTKLNKIISKLCNNKLQITLTTALPKEVNAAINGNNIILNGNNLKDIKDIICGIAHECLHFINKNLDERTEEFKNKWKELSDIIEKKYYQ